MTSNMIIQYGHRDEDDEYDSEEEERRKNGLFGGMMQHHMMNKRGSHTMGSSGTKGSGGGMALGAALANIKDNFNASMNFGDFDDDDNRSVSKKAKEAIKNFGDSLRFNKRDNRDEDDDSSSGEEESEDEDEEDDDDEEDSDSDEDEMDDDRSVASRTAKAMRKVTGKIGKALRLKSDDEDSDSDDDDSETEQEEDPLDNVRGSRGAVGSSSLLPRLVMGGPFGSSNKDKDMKHDNSQGSDSGGGGEAAGGARASRRRSNEREKFINPFRRSANSNSQQPHLRLPGFLTNSLTGGNGGGAGDQDDNNDDECGKNCQAGKAAARVLAQEEFDGAGAGGEVEEVPSRRRRREGRNNRLTRSATSDPHKSAPGSGRPGLHRCHTTTAAPADVSPSRKAAARVKAQEEFMEPAQAVWSMNVTEKMLEQATTDGVYVPPATGTKKKSRRQRSQK